MLGIKQAYKKLKESEEFKKEKGFFYLAFSISDNLDNNPWQLDFYNNEKINSYTVTDSSIKIEKENEKIQEKTKKIEKIDLEKLNIDLEEIKEIIENKLKENHLRPTKYIIILQNNEWNVSLVCSSFDILQMKINSETKEIESCKIDNILNFQQRL